MRSLGLIFYGLIVLPSTTKLWSMSSIGPMVAEIHHISDIASVNTKPLTVETLVLDRQYNKAIESVKKSYCSNSVTTGPIRLIFYRSIVLLSTTST